MYITPEWPAPSHIKAYTTLRSGGVSKPPFDQFNLATHVGDNEAHVLQNRKILKETLGLPADPIWIEQTHSTIAINAHPDNRECEADASFSNELNQVCVVLTADCLPILLCNKKGTYIAAIHAGWRGLANGIIESTLIELNLPNEEWLAWLGPAIGPANFEVGDEVRSQFLLRHPEALYAFTPSSNGRWLANLYALAKLSLLKQGIESIYGGQFCTYSDSKRFYSYRRDGTQTGRMASLIWIDSSSF